MYNPKDISKQYRYLAAFPFVMNKELPGPKVILTAMLRKSEKSVVRLLQHDQP